MSENERLTRKQDAGIAALLTHATFAEAAASIGIGESTLRRWSAQPAFVAALKAERRRAIDRVVALLQAAGAKAVATLLELRDAGPPAIRLRASLGLLDFMLKAADLDFEARLSALEATAASLMPRTSPPNGSNGNGRPAWR